jgi:hypothetical protein
MKDLQTVLDALERYQTKRQDFDTFTEAIAIVRGMMQVEPVAGIYENRKVSIGAPDSRDVENGWSPLFTAPQAVPAGFVLVPVDPTQEQLKAATACSAKLAIPSGEDYYRAMLAASPTD